MAYKQTYLYRKYCTVASEEDCNARKERQVLVDVLEIGIGDRRRGVQFYLRPPLPSRLLQATRLHVPRRRGGIESLNAEPRVWRTSMDVLVHLPFSLAWEQKKSLEANGIWMDDRP